MEPEGARPPSEHTGWLAIVVCLASHAVMMHASVLSVWPAQSESPVLIPVGSTHPVGAHPNMSCKAKSVPALPTHSSQSVEGGR